MLSKEWVVRAESPGETSYGCLGVTPFIRICTPEENNRINYQLNKKIGTGGQAPHTGYYLIKDIHKQKKWQSAYDEDAAKVCYKENIEDQFIDIDLSIRLQPFFNYISECLNSDKLKYKVNPGKLIDKVIHVEYSGLEDSNFNGKISKTYKILWSVLIN